VVFSVCVLVLNVAIVPSSHIIAGCACERVISKEEGGNRLAPSSFMLR